MIHHAYFFYPEDVLVAPTDSDWLQGAFDTLTRLFARLGLRTNVGNKVRMLCRPCCAVGTQLEAAYEWRMTGGGFTYRACQRL